MPETQPARYRRRAYQDTPRCDAIQYTGSNRLQLAKFAEGAVCFAQTATDPDNPDTADYSLALITLPGTNSLAPMPVDHYLIYHVTDSERDSSSWWSIMSPEQYSYRWETPNFPDNPHRCQPRTNPEDFTPDEVVALQYNSADFTAANRFAGGRLNLLPIYQPLTDRHSQLAILSTPAYQALAAVHPGNWLLAPVDPTTGETYPDEIEVISDKLFAVNYEPAK